MKTSKHLTITLKTLNGQKNRGFKSAFGLKLIKKNNDKN